MLEEHSSVARRGGHGDAAIFPSGKRIEQKIERSCYCGIVFFNVHAHANDLNYFEFVHVTHVHYHFVHHHYDQHDDYA